MRTRRICAVLALAAVAFTAAPVFTGCGSLDTTGVYHGDKTLYDADMAIDISYQTIHGFVKFEYENRKALEKYPQVTEFADTLRKEAPRSFQSAVAIRDAYKGSPTSENRSSLLKALDVIRALATQATAYMIQANSTPTAQPTQ